MPVQNVKLRATAAMPEAVAKRMTYRTRRLLAEGDEFEVPPSDARVFLKTKWAEEVGEPAPARRGPGRPPKAAAQTNSTSAEESWGPTRADLLSRAEELGVELPAGYVAKDKLIELIAEAEKGAP
jgi:hypothetical protein